MTKSGRVAALIERPQAVVPLLLRNRAPTGGARHGAYGLVQGTDRLPRALHLSQTGLARNKRVAALIEPPPAVAPLSRNKRVAAIGTYRHMNGRRDPSLRSG